MMNEPLAKCQVSTEKALEDLDHRARTANDNTQITSLRDIKIQYYIPNL